MPPSIPSGPELLLSGRKIYDKFSLSWSDFWDDVLKPDHGGMRPPHSHTLGGRGHTFCLREESGWHFIQPKGTFYSCEISGICDNLLFFWLGTPGQGHPSQLSPSERKQKQENKSPNQRPPNQTNPPSNQTIPAGYPSVSPAHQMEGYRCGPRRCQSLDRFVLADCLISVTVRQVVL